MTSDRPVLELRACLIQLERMLEKAKRFQNEYEAASEEIRDVSTLKHVIAFQELRSLDLLCVDAITRAVPGHPQLVEQWPIYETTGLDGPGAVVSTLLHKRTLLETAIALKEVSVDAGALPTPGKRQPLPLGYRKLAESVELFLADEVNECHRYERNVFVMTRFVPGNSTLAKIDSQIRTTLASAGLVGHTANDRCYPEDRNLWDNVCTYMLGCKFGIAVLEDTVVEEFNPNVALEYGFMRGLGKPTLLLKEKRFHLRADLLGTLWAEFDILQLDRSVPVAIKGWMADVGVST